MNRAEKLLQETPDSSHTPEHIEALELCAFDIAQEIKTTSEQISLREETYAEQAQGESNEQKRRAKKSELLRLDATYQTLQSERTERERLHLRVRSRAARLRREYRAALLETEIRLLGRRT